MNKINWEFIGVMIANVALWGILAYAVFIR